jgi:hypothetical protein
VGRHFSAYVGRWIPGARRKAGRTGRDCDGGGLTRCPLRRIPWGRGRDGAAVLGVTRPDLSDEHVSILHRPSRCRSRSHPVASSQARPGPRAPNPRTLWPCVFTAPFRPALFDGRRCLRRCGGRICGGIDEVTGVRPDRGHRQGGDRVNSLCRGSAERERKSLHARIEELDLQLSISDGLRLSDQLT